MNLQPLIDADRAEPVYMHPGMDRANNYGEPRVPRYEPEAVIAGRAPSQSWVPGHLRYLLHFYISTEPFPEPERSSQFYAESLGLFMDLDLIQYRDGIPTCTKRGEAFIRLLLNTPVPEERFTDPRNGEIV